MFSAHAGCGKEKADDINRQCRFLLILAFFQEKAAKPPETGMKRGGGGQCCAQDERRVHGQALYLADKFTSCMTMRNTTRAMFWHTIRTSRGGVP